MLEHAKDYLLEWPSSLKIGTNFRVGWVMPVWNRPAELSRSLESISQSDMSGSVLVIVDDLSDNQHTIKKLSEFGLSDVPVIKMYRRTPIRFRPNMQLSLRVAWDLLTNYLQCTYLGVLDSDTIVRKNWAQRLCEVADTAAKKYEYFVLSGFNTHRHLNHSVHSDYIIKKTIGGVNMLFPQPHYIETIRPALIDALWDWKVCAIYNYKKAPLLAVRPSVVQHIGRIGIWSKGMFQYDIALDYRIQFFSRYTIFYSTIQKLHALMNILQSLFRRRIAK